MITIAVRELPSGFKPYPFKTFRMRALTVNQALELGEKPTDREIRSLISKLTDEIDANLLIPIDLRFLIAVLAFNTEKDHTWHVTAGCPHCKDTRTFGFTSKDFPPMATIEASAPYPFTVDDGTHVYSIGYATVESMELYEKRDPDHKNYLANLSQYVVKIDDETDPERIYEMLGEITDFSLISCMLQIAGKYFAITPQYKKITCAKCQKDYTIPLSAIEVTLYTPFRDTETIGQYKTNFRV